MNLEVLMNSIKRWIQTNLLIIPRMDAYKSVKWVEKIVFTEKQELGYWEHRFYSPDGSIPGLKG